MTEHDVADMGELDYVDNDGNIKSFTEEFGAVLAEPPEADDETHNPVGFHPSEIDTSEYTAFPRDVTRTNADGEEEPVSALDAQEWTTDASSTAGSITVGDAEDALTVSTSSQTSGDVASATFSNFTIDSGEQRKMLQLVLDVNTLEASAVVNVKAVDAGGASVVTTIDSAADSAAESTIATTQGQGDRLPSRAREAVRRDEPRHARGDRDRDLRSQRGPDDPRPEPRTRHGVDPSASAKCTTPRRRRWSRRHSSSRRGCRGSRRSRR
ncbi:hypothetical protein JCM18549_00600 [Halolamina salina]